MSAEAVKQAVIASAAGAGSAANAIDAGEMFVWRIPLFRLREGDQVREYSPEFELDGETWRLLCFPRGNPNYPIEGCMAAFLELREQRAPYSVNCHFKMQMVHPTDAWKSLWREANHTFTDTEKDRGFNDLLKPATIATFTHADGCVVLNVSAWTMYRGYKRAQPQPDLAQNQPSAAESKAASPLTQPAVVAATAEQEEAVQSENRDSRLQCHICMDAVPDALTLCCTVLRVCGDCMHRLLQLQADGATEPRCPNCNQSSTKNGKTFGHEQIVWQVKL